VRDRQVTIALNNRAGTAAYVDRIYEKRKDSKLAVVVHQVFSW
jgi:hypothetical protein